MINFSIVGRMATPNERKNYYDWDKVYNERQNICHLLLKEFPELEFEVGGEISIDIYPIGNNKSQVLNYIKDSIYFFGDGIMPGKNDWRLAEVLKYPSRSFPVKSWQDTLNKLTYKDNLV
jgi:phosphomannomutase